MLYNRVRVRVCTLVNNMTTYRHKPKLFTHIAYILWIINIAVDREMYFSIDKEGE